MKNWIGAIFMLTLALMLTLNGCQNIGNTYEVDSSKCIGCAKCVSACGHGAISVSGGKATINASRCVGCGKCVSRCSYSAISLRN